MEEPDLISKNQTAQTASCEDGSGTMPSCAPLAVPYVPFQQKGAKKYSQTDALNNGTLFPGLNLPFGMKVSGRNAVDSALSAKDSQPFYLLGALWLGLGDGSQHTASALSLTAFTPAGGVNAASQYARRGENSPQSAKSSSALLAQASAVKRKRSG